MSEERPRKAMAIVGINNTGKTTQILKMIKDFRHGKVIILDKMDEKAYKIFPELPRKELIGHLKRGKYRIHSPHRNEQLQIVDEISENLKPGALIVLEDASAYIPQKEYKPLTDMFGARRHRRGDWDIVMSFWSINRIPPFVLEALDVIILFKTNDNPEKHLKDSCPQPQVVIDTYMKVENHPDPHYFEIIELRKNQVATNQV